MPSWGLCTTALSLSSLSQPHPGTKALQVHRVTPKPGPCARAGKEAGAELLGVTERGGLPEGSWAQVLGLGLHGL